MNSVPLLGGDKGWLKVRAAGEPGRGVMLSGKGPV